MKTVRLRNMPMSEKIMMKITLDPGSGCWLWEEHLDKRGYGKVRNGAEKLFAHRASYSAFVGKIPDHLFVCHKCDTPACVRPEHLFLGTPADNMADMVAKKRSARGFKEGWYSRKANRFRIEDVRYIKSSNLRICELARYFEVSETAIDDILRGRTWKWVA